MKKLLDHLLHNPEGYWFKRKLFGWGWYPANWKGWLVTVVYGALMVGIAYGPSDKDPNLLTKTIFVVLPAVIFTGIFIWIAYKKGEKPRWQWGWNDKDQ